MPPAPGVRRRWAREGRHAARGSRSDLLGPAGFGAGAGGDARRRGGHAGVPGLPATIVGSNGPDTIEGTAAADVIVGRGGDDAINGMGGDDIICGGGGGDVINGGSGADVLSGGPGDDEIAGGCGQGHGCWPAPAPTTCFAERHLRLRDDRQALRRPGGRGQRDGASHPQRVRPGRRQLHRLRDRPGLDLRGAGGQRLLAGGAARPGDRTADGGQRGHHRERGRLGDHPVHHSQRRGLGGRHPGVGVRLRVHLRHDHGPEQPHLQADLRGHHPRVGGGRAEVVPLHPGPAHRPGGDALRDASCRSTRSRAPTS